MPEPVDAARPRGGGMVPRSILIVEHETRIARDMQSSLVRLGYDVPVTAASASEALEAVETYRPDLILMDVCLEGDGDGIAAAAAIRARHPTPVVFLSANSDDATLMRAQVEAQPHGYLLKPYQERDLRAAVEVALQRHMLEQEISQQRSLLAGVLSGMSDALAAADVKGDIVLVNDAGRKAFGDRVTSAGLPPNSRTHRIYLPDQETLVPNESLPLVRALTGEIVRDLELFIRSDQQPNGRWYSVNAEPLFDLQGAVCGAVQVGRDITNHRAARFELQQQSATDALTGVYNRRGFMDVAGPTFENARRTGHHPAVFFIDLNGMKRVNDSFGHPEGDRLLVDLTWILRACFRTSDIVGRLGGDEFVVLAPDAGDHADILRERLRAAVDQFNAASERSYRISISVGLSTGDAANSVGLAELVEQADKRMYEDKLSRAARRRLQSDTRPPPEPSLSAPHPESRDFGPPGLACIAPPPRPPSRWPRPIGSPQIQMAPKRILLVDDEPHNLVLLERLLAPLGHELIRAEDGQSAIRALMEDKPDLVLLDLVMPGLDGVDILTHVRTNMGGEYVPVIIITAHSEREHRMRGLEAGADDFIEKPADGRDLRVRVSTQLQLKESREALCRANDELASRNADLNRASLQQRELTSFVVHDLKNPLAVVSTNVEFSRDCVDGDREELNEALGDAAVACTRLRSRIDDLLVVSRLEETGLPSPTELVVLWDLLGEVFKEYARRAASKHVEFLRPEHTYALVKADRSLLQRVFENILDNSLRYTPAHGKIGIATRVNGLVEITVSNNGPSIPPAERLRIFDKFARLEKSGGRSNAGLGLYFCKRVVEGLGGHIEVTETPEWPTSFVISFPRLA
jgi:diguanylate cyclase (GGDEF)-like protein